jgi:tripartite-type tricarboxylate transporter receptor subunit TctC
MKDRSRFFKTFLLGLAGCSVFMFFSATAFAAADTYPSKPVKLIIPWPPGGAVDIIGRLLVPFLSEQLGKPVVVDNRGGAGGTLGLAMAAKADPDGYTLTMISDSYAYKPALGEQLPFHPVKAWTPIAQIAVGANVLTINPTVVPAKNVKEFIALLKQKPGQLICGASGNASVSHMTAELFKMKSGTDFKIVQFKGSGPAFVDLMGGHSHFSFLSLLVAKAEAQTGRLRILGTSGSKRTALMPELPTVAEAGVAGHDAPNWWGLVAPAGTPQPIVDKLSQAVKAALATPQAEKQFLAAGADADYKGPKELGAALDAEIIKWTQVVKEANIKIEN